MKTSSLPLAVAGLYQKFTLLLDKLQSPFLLCVRLLWGFQFAQSGLGKWRDIHKVIDFFTGIPIPFPVLNAYLVATVELGGGCLLILGLFSRLTCIPLIISMVVAYITTEQDALHALPKDFDPFLTAAPFLFLFAAMIIFVFGPGKISIDHLLAKKFKTPVE
ncbi:MAG: DoxX family protein [Chthoniobacterales bacterium]